MHLLSNPSKCQNLALREHHNEAEHLRKYGSPHIVAEILIKP